MLILVNIEQDKFDLLKIATNNGLGNNANKILANGKPIYTNGDLFRVAFPNYKISESENNILIEDIEGGKIYVNKEWFNKPYKEV